MELGEAKIKDEESLKIAQHKKEERSEKVLRENGSKNSIASLIKFVGWLMVIITLISGVNFALQHNTLGYIYLFSGIVSGILLVGFSEVIILLQKIYINTRK
jgi:hypothetical protein